MNTEHKSNTDKSIRDLWCTPKFVFNYYNKRFNFHTDMAASKDNALCDHYFSEENSASKAEESDYKGNVWCNPPFSNIHPWVNQCCYMSEVTNKVFVLLLPSDTSVRWFREAFNRCSECHFISGRLAFINAETKKAVSGNNKGTVVFVFNPNSPFKSQVAMINRDYMK